MRACTLHALAAFAAKDGPGAAEILREFAMLAQEAAKVDGLHGALDGASRDHERKERHWRDQIEQCDQLRQAEKSKRDDARNALGDGWHPLKGGGAVLIEGGKPVRLRDGGEHTDERRKTIRVDVTTLGFQWYRYVNPEDPDGSIGAWDAAGEAAVILEESCPF